MDQSGILVLRIKNFTRIIVKYNSHGHLTHHIFVHLKNLYLLLKQHRKHFLEKEQPSNATELFTTTQEEWKKIDQFLYLLKYKL